MIDYEKQTMRFGADRREIPILEFRAWYQTPFGLYDNVADAIKRLKENDLPIMAMRPVVVAIGPEGIYEVCP